MGPLACQYRKSLSLIYAHVTSRIKEIALSHVSRKALSHSIGPMLHVESKKRTCHLVNFRGQKPLSALADQTGTRVLWAGTHVDHGGSYKRA